MTNDEVFNEFIRQRNRFGELLQSAQSAVSQPPAAATPSRKAVRVFAEGLRRDTTEQMAAKRIQSDLAAAVEFQRLARLLGEVAQDQTKPAWSASDVENHRPFRLLVKALAGQEFWNT